jgi:hypothetical protein
VSESTHVCGLPIEGGEHIGQPLAALVVVKSFDEDSEVGVSYQVRATSGLTTVECLGMAELAVLKLRNALSGGSDDD